MTGRDDSDAAVHLMQQLAELFSTSVEELLQGSAAHAKQMTDVPDPIVLAAVVNGGLIGILTYMAKRLSEGRMDDPHGHLTRLFHLAGAQWEEMRPGKGTGKVTLQ
ncbi:hypothetical protein GR702_09080 [Novosphingobium sp. FGD1]|uniref:Uncharacterized protein n=1 Tax=Novosphingobium silvae TaxID=2692619 RepID=A0A7X4GG42_9SPHN|nr:hypothetical protein [Novosphingobium silvae]MYL97923.1 hypothetical protein [Novosphingobium silvae]